MITLRKLVDNLITIPQDATVGIHPETGALVFADKKGSYLKKHDIVIPKALSLFPEPEPQEAAPFRFGEWHMLQDENHCCQCSVEDNSLSDDHGSKRGDTKTSCVEFTIKELGIADDEVDSLQVRLSSTLLDWLNGKSEFEWLRKRGICKEFYADLCAGNLLEDLDNDFDVNAGYMDMVLTPKWRERIRVSLYCDYAALSSLYCLERLKTGGVSFFEEPSE